MMHGPFPAMMQLIGGYWYTQALYVVARLGVADRLREGPQAASELAAACGADDDSLYRLLRALASIGVFAEHEGGRFSLTPLSACLRTDVDGSLHDAALLAGEPDHWRAWGGLLESVVSGQTAFEQVHGRGYFDHLAERAELGAAFQRVMRGNAGYNDLIARSFDFSTASHVLDVGGGDGSLARAIRLHHPSVRLTVFDRSEVVAAAPAGDLAWAAGDFRESIPPGADLLVLRFVLHDWDDDVALQILRRCREALPAGGRVLLVESLLAPLQASSASLKDVAMMALTGGRERTAEGYQALLEAAGFRLEGVLPTEFGVSLLVAAVRRCATR